MQNNYPMYPTQQSMYYPPPQPIRNVWTDLDTERAEMTTAERDFVEKDKEYQNADYTLQVAFQAFLQSKFRDDFLSSDTKNLAEKKLLALKVARKGYEKENDDVLNDPEVKALIEKKRGKSNGNGN